MPKYSPQSEARLNTCHEDIQKIFRYVIKYVDHTILCGHRGEQEQNEAVASGASETPYPQSKHNATPSNAVDALPYPFSWDDLDGKNGTAIQIKAIVHTGMFIGYVRRVAQEMYIKGEIGSLLISGVDWDGDWNVQEHKFIDMPHHQRAV